MMKLSKYNITSRIRDTEEYFIVNLLSGHGDILSAAEYSLIENGEALTSPLFTEKGYAVEEEEEKRLYREKYFQFLEERDQEEIQIFFVPNYTCNFNCFYCYQESYGAEKAVLTEEIIEAFFRYVDQKFAGRQKYLTIFGGEPLLPNNRQKELIEKFISESNKRKLGISVVTNGYNLKEYLPVLEKASLREIQVTLDGTADIHNRRRPLKGGGATFESIVQGIDEAMTKRIPINLRVVVDRDNIENLPALAQFAKEKGWTENKGFKTQLGRNYELHSCQKDQNLLLSRVEMFTELYTLIKQHPVILEFHKPAYSLSKYLMENGKLPAPVFDTCPGTKYEWAFDYTGRIYSCTATVGKAGEELGTYYPEIRLEEEKIACWEERDVSTIPECRECNMQLVCGGGCASVAKNQTGRLLAPDCRPVKELIEMGLNLYGEE